jgi:hypothetical protein
MSGWETKDIIVVASSVLGFAGTVIVQLLQHVFTARRERSKIVEGIRRDLYQKITVSLDKAINLLGNEHPSIRKAFDALDELRNIFLQHPIDISEDMHRACFPILNKEWFEEDFEVALHNTGSVTKTLDNLDKIKSRILRTARRELRATQPLKTALHSITIIINTFHTVYYRRLRRWFRRIGHRILKRFK